MSKTYTIGRRASGRVYAEVEETTLADDGEQIIERYALPHLDYHSPTGFNFGYSGSGPADLARSIVGDLRQTGHPEAGEYQKVKEVFIAPIQGDGPIEISGEAVAALIGAAGCCGGKITGLSEEHQ